MTEALPSPWRGGGRVGPFLLQSLEGRGASADVWRACVAPDGPPVALKVLVDEGRGGVQGAQADADRADSAHSFEEARAERRRRFLEESRTAFRLQHPHIVACLGAGEEAGRPWMALEWMSGHDLTRYTARHRLLPEPLVLEFVAQMARALAHAHRLGIVHRDVKPANVRVNLPKRLVKLADFGVARLEDATRTRTGIVLGTPAYMAPEQLAGAAADVRADLYALAVVLYELLTAHRPHEASSLGELLRQVVSKPAPDLREWRPDLPAALAAVVAKALSREPAQRHPDGDEFAAALEAAAQSLSSPLSQSHSLTFPNTGAAARAAPASPGHLAST